MTSQDPIPKQQYRADIQGLRALAIIPVVVYHAHAAWAPGGFVGVDIFFVISGYLITRILTRELETDRFSIVNFYQRRVRRLFPALYLVFALVLTLGVALLPPVALADLGKATAATVAFVSNFYFWRTSGYFDPASEFKPLLHTWSLAVEEQFYLLFPIFLFLLYRYLRRQFPAALWLCAFASLGIAVWQARAHPLDGFYLPFGRAYELLIGAIVATAPLPRIARAGIGDALSVTGLVMIAASIALFHSGMAFPGAWALLPCVGSALILYTGANRTTLGGRWLSHPLPVFFGSISYSLYLWHWPLLSYARFAMLRDPGPPVAVAALAIAVLAAWLSYRFVEQPFLKGKLPGRRIFVAGGAAMTVTLAIAALLVVTHGLPQRFAANAHALFAAEEDHNPRRNECHASGRTIAYADNCVFGAPGTQPDLAVWGDSLGAELSAVLGERAASKGHAVMEITASSCPPSADRAPEGIVGCVAHNRDTLAALIADPRIRTVVLVSAYGDYPEADRPGLLEGYEKAASALHGAGKKLVMIDPIPKQPFPAPTALGLMAQRGQALDGFGVTQRDFTLLNAPYQALLDRLAPALGADRVVPAARLCQSGLCRAYRADTGVLYFDDLHPSLTGARYILGPAQ